MIPVLLRVCRCVTSHKDSRFERERRLGMPSAPPLAIRLRCHTPQQHWQGPRRPTVTGLGSGASSLTRTCRRRNEVFRKVARLEAAENSRSGEDADPTNPANPMNSTNPVRIPTNPAAPANLMNPANPVNPAAPTRSGGRHLTQMTPATG